MVVNATTPSNSYIIANFNFAALNQLCSATNKGTIPYGNKSLVRLKDKCAS